jgi:transcriptional regulator with XRE-family HTH domain
LSGDARDSAAGSAEPSVGAALLRLRKRAGLTGSDLGRLVMMSQAKISRIETGSTVVSPEDVDLLARTLGASAEEVARLIDLAERQHNRLTDWREAGRGVVHMQRGIGRLESGTRELRVFQPAVVVGLMQTSEYARTVLKAAHDIGAGINWDNATAVPEALAERLHRQVALDDPGKQFFFVMTESALRNRVVTPMYMRAQVARIREVSRQPNVSLLIIPADAGLNLPPYHGFELLDDKSVVLDTFNTTIVGRGRDDIALYRHVFDKLAGSATAEIEPILDRYLDLYRDEDRRTP